jgi:hypothetical protein
VLGCPYNAKRDEAIADLPFCQETVSGLNTIVPPQQNPAHVIFTGATTLRTASIGAVVFEGSATEYWIPSAFVYVE